jgi:hypothetical protein
MRHPPEMRREAKWLRAQGHSFVTIARRLNVTWLTAKRWTEGRKRRAPAPRRGALLPDVAAESFLKGFLRGIQAQ